MATIFQALTWHAEDTDGQHVISIFGRTDDGKSVCVSTNFEPYFFVKVSNRAQEYSMFQSMKGATGYTSVRGKDLWGFQNNQETHFMKVEFNTLADMKSCEYNLRKDHRIRMYEANVEPLLRFMHRTGIQSTGFLSTGTNCIESSFSRCDIGLFCRDWKTLKPVDRDDNVKFIVASFDIETNSSTGKFPDPNLPGDCVFQIAVTLKRFGESEIYKKVCLCYKKTSGPDVISYNTERELLLGFKKFLLENDVDIMTGWNIFGFDLEFLYVRAAMTRCLAQFSDLSKIVGRECEVIHKNLSSSALGNNVLKLLPMPGRFIFDLFHVIKREKNLDSYSLNFVSKYFLGDQKIDMSAKEMFKRFEKGDPDELGEVAEYCIKDTVLPHALMDKLCNLLNLLEMAKATWVPISYLSERGQQIKVFSQLCRKARELGFMVPTIRVSKNAQGPVDGYEGATVLEAQTGAYYVPITALDFEGLYPSIMIAHNFCYSTLVMNPKYDNLPGVTYETFGTHKFVQGVPSLLPEVLKELKQFRKKAKADMAAATGIMKQVYDGKQLAYKVSMNSVYGFTGASKGMLPCLAIASSVTMRGRGMIDETKNYVEQNFPGAKVRYGDSVTEDTPLLLRIRGKVSFKKVKDLWHLRSFTMANEDGKLFGKLEGFETWTEQGWTQVHTIIAHGYIEETYRITTQSGIVTVTKDHSLLDSEGTMVKPKDVQVGTKLLHSYPECISVADDMNTINDSVSALKLFHTYKAVGYHPSVSYDKGIYTVTPHYYPTGTEILSIERLSARPQDVYDLTTENHHFHAGVGSIIVHNTDSVMVEFDVGGRTGQEAIEYSWELGEQAAEQCTKLFKKPNNLELEKVYCPYFLYSKKRYAAKLWTKNKKGQMNMDKIDVKGLQLVRRDNTPYVREVCKELLDVILESKNPEGAKLLAHSRAAELLDGRVSNEKLMLSQRLGDSYKSDNLPHVQVVKKMRAREPGSEPQSGDRVPYVIVRGPKGDKAFEKSEDPVWAKQNNVKLDYEYYFTNKFMNPVCDLLEPLVPDPKDEIFGDLIPGYRKKVKCHKITDMFAKFDVKQKARQEEKDLQ
jgi:DNA polymerase delta subunit 1